MYSIRTRLLTGISVGMAMLLIVFSFVIYEVVNRSLNNQFDASLLSTARMLEGSVEQEKGNISLELEPEQMSEFKRTEHPTFYELRLQDGTVAAKSPSMGEGSFLRGNDFTDTPVFRSLIMKNDRPARAVGFKFSPRTADSEEGKDNGQAEVSQVTLIVARDSGIMLYNLRFLRWLLLISSSSIIALSFIVGGVIVRKGLAPLNFLAAEISAIKENNLTSRITAQSLPAEIQPIKERLNDMLVRLEASFNRERRITADVAHELRTPLAGMRSTIEVALTRVREREEYQTTLSDCLTIADGMQKMINNLLALIRIDTNQATFRRERIHAAEIADSCWRLLSHRAQERDITFENRIPAKLTSTSDADGLSMVMSNILDNAVEYTNEGGKIRAEGHEAGDKIEITIANTGCRLTSDEVSQVFDCFWRGDASRTGTGTHCGLGLALVQRIVGALGGSASAEVQPGGIFVMHLVFPV
jgi:two-component system, OmpR family, heavy metal sensor histidine kinase CusS